MRVAARRCAGGLTLIEMLVTLALASMISLVLWQALAQLARVERLLESEREAGGSTAVRIEWLRYTIEALLPGEPDSPDRLQGGESELRGLTSAPPIDCRAGVCRVSLALRFDDRAQRTELVVSALDRPDLAPQVLLAWPGQQGRFRYLDGGARWRDAWPPPMGVPVALPRAIALDTGPGAIGVLVAAPRHDETPVPSRRALENL